MNESKTEKKNIQEQNLEMARQALGRVKEMNLTPEQREELMERIEQAQTAEKAGNISSAIILYKELKDLIIGWQNPETLADKQIKTIRKLIVEIRNGREENSRKKRRIGELEKQIELIQLDDEDKTKIAKSFRIDAKLVPEEEEVLPVFFDVVGKHIPREHLFLAERYFNKKGKLLKLKFGVAGADGLYYQYMLKGYADGEPGFSDKTMISETTEVGENNFILESLAELTNKGDWKEV